MQVVAVQSIVSTAPIGAGASIGGNPTAPENDPIAN